MTSSICVVGSINMDLVVRAERFAHPGETLLGGDFAMHPGGKGANQAVAASRMGANVSLVGCVGDDDWGSELRGVLAAEGVDIHRLRTCEKAQTGVGVITVVDGGENSIVVASGANARLRVEDVEEASGEISEAEVLLLQAEIPSEVNARAIELARKAGTRVLFNAAPAGGVDRALLGQVDVLVVNKEEARTLAGDEECGVTGLARRLATLGPERVVITLGNEGAIHFNGTEIQSCEAFPVEAVDTTAAGDAFVGALVVLRSEGERLKDAVRHACAAAALTTTVRGAIPSLPTREAVEKFLQAAPSKSVG